MIYCIGTSHVTVFSGRDVESNGFPNVHGDVLPEFRTAHVNGFLAYSIGDENHRAHKEIHRILEQIPQGSSLLFVFGEVDCRAQIPKHKDAYGSSLERATHYVVERYVQGVMRYVAEGYDVSVWGPHAIYRADDIWRAAGPWEDIIAAAALFNWLLQFQSQFLPIRYFSIFKWMMANRIYEDKSYYRDPTHINRKCLPQIYNTIFNGIPAPSD